MSTDDALTILTRAAEAGGQLLRAEADRSGPNPARLLLTFDVGRVLIEPRVGALAAVEIVAAESSPPNLQDLNEEEPWWRLLGSPLSRVRSEGDGAAVRLQFHEAGDNQRFVRVESSGSGLRVGLEARE